MGRTNQRRQNRYYKCEIKRQYIFLADAFAAANAVRGHNAKGLGVYICPHCGRYHLGHASRGYPMKELPYFGA